MTEIKTVPFIFDIPENTIELEISAKIYQDGKIRTCCSEIRDMANIRKGIVVGEEYDDAHAIYELTDEVKKELGIDG